MKKMTRLTKHEISHFYVASCPSRSYRKGKEMYTKKSDAHAESLFCSFRWCYVSVSPAPLHPRRWGCAAIIYLESVPSSKTSQVIMRSDNKWRSENNIGRISLKLFLVIEVCFPERPRILIYDSCLLLTGKCFELTAASKRHQIWLFHLPVACVAGGIV